MLCPLSFWVVQFLKTHWIAWNVSFCIFSPSDSCQTRTPSDKHLIWPMDALNSLYADSAERKLTTAYLFLNHAVWRLPRRKDLWTVWHELASTQRRRMVWLDLSRRCWLWQNRLKGKLADNGIVEAVTFTNEKIKGFTLGYAEWQDEITCNSQFRRVPSNGSGIVDCEWRQQNLSLLRSPEIWVLVIWKSWGRCAEGLICNEMNIIAKG